MKTSRKPLFILKQGDKFIYNNIKYTLYQIENGMAEVFSENRFWAWPLYTGKEMLYVNCI